MHSCIYEGRVTHRRFRPVARQFSYPLFMAYVDLSELDELFGRRGLWSTKSPAVARFRRADHLGAVDVPLDEAVRHLVQSRLGWCPAGAIRMLTHFRYFGFAMNPISLFYCFDADDRRVEAVVAEVNNTPWNEQHCYVLNLRDASQCQPLAASHAKQFHVSPFLPMEMEYGWQLSEPGERLQVEINARASGTPVLQALLALERTPITRIRLAGILLRYPLMTLQVFLAIYWQALLIRLAKVPFVPHPGSIRVPADAHPPANNPFDLRTRETEAGSREEVHI